MENRTDEIRKLADALTLILPSLTARERSDLHLLYKSRDGFPYHFDTSNRPHGDTLRSSSTVGSRIKGALNRTRGYGMNFVGYGDEQARWHMNADFRAAIDLINLFPKVVLDVLPVDENESSSATEREQVNLARIGQGKFRERALALSQKCRITGVSDPRFLRASHIKPWKDCTNAERLDGENGLMLAPHVDHLFDRGYLSFGDDGHMLLSDHLPLGVLSAWSLVQPTPVAALTPGQCKYMRFHRTNKFNKPDLSLDKTMLQAVVAREA